MEAEINNTATQDQSKEPDYTGPRETARFWRQNTIEGIKMAGTLESYPDNVTDEELYNTLKANSAELAQLNAKDAAIQARYERMFNRRQESANQLTDRIRTDLDQSQHRYEIHDPTSEATYRLQTAELIVAKAEEFDATRFQGFSADKTVTQFSKVDGEWKRDDGKAIGEVQAAIDQESIAAIMSRADLRKQAGRGVDSDTDKKLALVDATEFLRIQNPEIQELAAVVMAGNTKDYPDYKTGLEVAYSGYIRNPPKISPIAEKVAVLNALHIEKQASLESTAQAGQPDQKQELHNIDPAALERVAANRQRDFAQAKEALGLNAIEPNIEKQQQQLDSENEQKRQAWLKKGPENQQQAQPKEGGNKVESDEIFTASQDIKPLVPPDIEKRYLRVGDKFYHPKNTDLVAFEDKGNKLETKSNSESIAESMVRIAEARGWDEIKVSGTETFKREAWLEAASRGMHVKGYTPSEQDKATLDKRISEAEANKIEKDNKPFRARENDAEQTSGDRGKVLPFRGRENATEQTNGDNDGKAEVLVAHGADKYQHDKNNSASYFVTTKDSQGKQTTTWGVDLERAMDESGAKIGDKITLTNEGRKAVTIEVPVKNDQGKVIGHEPKETHRNQWNVEMAETFAKESPEEAVKKYPELAGAAALVAALDKKAEADGLNLAQRGVVNARVRQNILNSIERGDIPEVKIKESQEVTKNKETEREYSR